MKQIHALHFSVLVKDSEFGFEPDFLAEMIKSDLTSFFADSKILKIEDIPIQIETLDPIDQFSRVMFQVKLTLEKKTDKLFSYVVSKLSDKDSAFLKETLETRIDEGCNCYLRFDKKEFIENKKLVLVDHGNCIHLRLKVAAFPANEENAIIVMNEVLS